MRCNTGQGRWILFLISYIEVAILRDWDLPIVVPSAEFKEEKTKYAIWNATNELSSVSALSAAQSMSRSRWLVYCKMDPDAVRYYGTYGMYYYVLGHSLAYHVVVHIRMQLCCCSQVQIVGATCLSSLGFSERLLLKTHNSVITSSSVLPLSAMISVHSPVCLQCLSCLNLLKQFITPRWQNTPTFHSTCFCSCPDRNAVLLTGIFV